MKRQIILIIACALIVSLSIVQSTSAQDRGVIVTTLSSTQIRLQWQDSYYDELGFKILRQTRTDGSCAGLYQVVATLPPANAVNSTVVYTDTDLTPNTTYCYAVRVSTSDGGGVIYGPYIATTLPPDGTSTPVPTSTPTPTPITGTTTPTATPSPTPQPTATPMSDDYHFLIPPAFGSPWKNAGGVTWIYSRYTIPAGGQIWNQMEFITTTNSYTISVRAMVASTGTLVLTVGDEQVASWTITMTRMATYALPNPTSLDFPGIVRLSTLSGGPITVDSIIMQRSSTGLLYDSDQQTGNESIDISDFIGWFTPIDIPSGTLPSIFQNTDLNGMLQQMAQVMATTVVIMSPNVLMYYFAGRIAILAVAWLFSFVTNKIGHKAGVNMGAVGETYHVVMGMYRNRSNALPRLPKFRLLRL